MTKTLIVGLYKGGSGKSTISTNQAALLSQNGRTILIDIDTQGNDAMYYGFNPSTLKSTIVDLANDPAKDKSKVLSKYVINLKNKGLENLDILPSNSKLNDFFEKKSNNAYDRIYNIICDIAQSNIYEYIVIDTAPAWNIMLIDIAKAADCFLIPFIPEMGCEFALNEILGFLPDIQKVNPNLKTIVMPNRFKIKKYKGNVVETIAKQIVDKTTKKIKKYKNTTMSDALSTSDQYQNAANAFNMPLSAVKLNAKKLKDEEFKKLYGLDKSSTKPFNKAFKENVILNNYILNKIK